MKKNLTYLGQFKQSLLFVKENIRIPFLVAVLMDTTFVALAYLLLNWFMGRITTLLTSLETVNLNSVMIQSNSQLQSSLGTLQGFMQGIIIAVVLMLSALAFLWFITRWVLWNTYEQEPLLRSAFFRYCFRSKVIFLLGLPFLAYPLVIISNATKIGDDATIWIGIFFAMVFLSMHFACINSKIFFEGFSFKAHVGKVITSGWKSLYFIGPYYVAVMLISTGVFIGANMLSSVTTPLAGQVLLLVGWTVLIGTCRLFVRSLRL